MVQQLKKREYWPTTEWITRSPESLGMDNTKIMELDRQLSTQYKNINGIMIIRNGYSVFERYNNGFGPYDTHNVASVTKSFISALIGIAIDKGYIKDVDQKVLSFFPEFPKDTQNIQKRAITLRNLLTMTTPFPWNTNSLMQEPLDRLRRQKDWVKYILTTLGQKGIIGKFQYSSAGVHLLSAIISKTTGMNAREFANIHLFRPIGINEIPDHEMKSFTIDDVFGKNMKGWIKDPSGITTGGWGLTITLRDMARFGFLYLNNGKWENSQIISKKWVGESTTPYTEEYGYLWWVKNLGNLRTFTAAGFGGNIIFCIPEKDLVIVIASKLEKNPKHRDTLIENYVIPSC